MAIYAGALRPRRESRADMAGLKRLYTDNAVAKVFLDHLASRTNDSKLTKFDRAVQIVTARGVPDSKARIDLRQVFKELEAAGCGRYVIGRRQHPSRFEWSVSLRTVGRAASGADVAIQEVEPEADVEEAEPLEAEHADGSVQALDHAFQLRPDLRISFRLPADLTSAEAGRLADFVRTLPFGP